MNGLTPEEKEEFKRLYNEGFSSREIFEKLGRPYTEDEVRRGQSIRRMIYYRKRLGLHKRGMGFRPPWRRSKRIAERISLLEDRLKRWDEKRKRWQEELARLMWKEST